MELGHTVNQPAPKLCSNMFSDFIESLLYHFISHEGTLSTRRNKGESFQKLKSNSSGDENNNPHTNIVSLEKTKRVSSDTCSFGNILREVPKEKGLSGVTLQSARLMKCEYA